MRVFPQCVLYDVINFSYGKTAGTLWISDYFTLPGRKLITAADGRKNMTQKGKSKQNTGNKNAGAAVNLFSEWPAQADIVAGFGGNPDKVLKNQWNQKRDAGS